MGDNKTLFVAMLGMLLASTAVQGDSSIAISAGSFDYHNDNVTAYGIEYRGAPYADFLEIRPIVGVEANTDDAYWFYAGGRYEFDLGSRWRFSPHLSVSFYEQGDSVDLGGEFQFRTGAELARQLTEKVSIYLNYYHLSNAGLNDVNPGANNYLIGLEYRF